MRDATATPAEGPDGAPADGIVATARARLRWFALDRRTLGLGRIMLGALLLLDLAHRHRSWTDLYSDAGVQPRIPFLGALLFNLVGTPAELTVVFWVLALAYTCVLFGLYWRVAHLIAFFAWASMSSRLMATQNAGYALVSDVLLWTAFLPMADRFSLDALRASLATRSEGSAADLARAAPDAEVQRPVVSLAALAVFLQIVVVYFISAVSKSGVLWKNLVALHYVLYLDQFATPLAAFVRARLSLGELKILTASALLLELSIPGLVVLPRWQSRVAGFFVVALLHTGFALFLILGPFSWICICLAFLIVPGEAWDVVGRALRRRVRARTVVVDERDERAMATARLLARLDGLRLLDFASGSPGDGVSVRDHAGTLISGRRALAQAVAALPLGPLFAWAFATPFGDLVLALARPFSAALVRLPRFPSSSSRWAPRLREGGVVIAMVIATLDFFASMPKSMAAFRIRRPRIAASLIRVFNLRQSWSLFAPNVVGYTNFVVIDAETVDGRHVDPLTGAPPRTRFEGPLSAEGFPQHWTDYARRIISFPPAYRDGLCRWAGAYGTRTGRPEDRVVRARAYMLYVQTPPPDGALRRRTWTRDVCVLGSSSLGPDSDAVPDEPVDGDDGAP